MKYGIVRGGDSLNALMIDRDDHDGASSAAPKSRHHPQEFSKKYNRYQIVSGISGMMHNHPSGDPTPSTADIRMTQDVVAIAKPLGISVHDHIIIGRNGHASFRGLGLL